METYIAGADGYSAGWVVVREISPGDQITWQVVPTLEALFDRLISPSLLAIDIPIGLPDRGTRRCDVDARSLLGRGRAEV